jgi:hypothetical protein
VVIAVVAVAALAAAGVLRLGTSSSGPAADETFSQALGRAQSESSSTSGGPWTAVAGAAVLTTVAVSEPASNLTNSKQFADCTVTWTGSLPSVLTVPATPAGAATGTSAYWFFVLKNGTNALEVESVSEGAVTPLITVYGGECSVLATDLDAFPGGMPDSPAVIAAVNAAGGSAFLSAHANATQLWGVDGGVTVYGITIEPEWTIAYTTCSATASSSQAGAVFNASVNGLTAAVTSHNTSAAASCGTSGVTGPSLTAPTSFVTSLVRKAI